jgi:hypothetical protein
LREPEAEKITSYAVYNQTPLSSGTVALIIKFVYSLIPYYGT